MFAGLFYLAVSGWGFGYLGFPLDDAWIHQTYARSLAYQGQLAFVPGETSAGSTAPLWSLLLSVGYLLRIPFQLWAYGLGVLFLGWTGWTIFRLGTALFPKHRRVGLLAGLFSIFEWHLIWAAVSGMETILFVWLSVLLVERYTSFATTDSATKHPFPSPSAHSKPEPPIPQSPSPNPHPLQSAQAQLPPTFTLQPFYLGLLGGLLILTRPEGVGLVGLVGLDMAYRTWSRRAELASWPVHLLGQWTRLVSGLALLLLPYVIFHLWLTGLPFPNTFYAKQAEYRVILTSIPLWWRLFGKFGPPVETVQGVFRVIFIGPQILLLPGLIFGGWLTLKERRTELLLIWGWWISFLLLYGLRLPVTYQHGRYQIPAIPWIILLGVWGTAHLVLPRARQHLLRRVAGRALSVSLVVLVLAFFVIGARAYGRDVRFIETEMVATAKWLNQHTAPHALIAAHDIGAIGYFTQRPLIDLAGLITPEVIPIIRNEAALFDFMQSEGSLYLVTFPSWYPTLTQNPALSLVYTTDAPWAPGAGGDNMAVYKIKEAE